MRPLALLRAQIFDQSHGRMDSRQLMELLDAYPWILAVAIFLARVVDVSLGTVRTILVFRSHRFLAAAIGFVEILIWLAAAGQVFKNLDAWYLAVAYAGGFAAGNAAGIWLESKLAIGSELVRAISRNPEVHLAESLRVAGYSVTEIPGTGDDGQPVEVLLVVERRRQVPALLGLITESDPGAVWTINDVKCPKVPLRSNRGQPDERRTPVKKK